MATNVLVLQKFWAVLFSSNIQFAFSAVLMIRDGSSVPFLTLLVLPGNTLVFECISE